MTARLVIVSLRVRLPHSLNISYNNTMIVWLTQTT